VLRPGGFTWILTGYGRRDEPDESTGIEKSKKPT